MDWRHRVGKLIRVKKLIELIWLNELIKKRLKAQGPMFKLIMIFSIFNLRHTVYSLIHIRHLSYSYLKESTGLALAALMA